MIKGLTDNGARFPKLGTLRKGAPKTDRGTVGADLGENFRFSGVDDEIQQDFIQHFDSDVLSDLPPLMLPYPTVDQCWQAWNEEWSASSLRHRCDGEIVKLIADGDSFIADPTGPDGLPMLCPGGCKPCGYLEVVIPSWQRLGSVTVLTTSVHDIKNIDGCLRLLAFGYADLRAVRLILKRVKRKVSAPKPDGKGRMRVEKWLLHLEPDPEQVRALTAWQGTSLTSGDDTKLLMADVDEEAEMDSADDENVEGEVVETGSQSHANGNGFGKRIEACSTYETLRALWPEIEAIEKAEYKENVKRLLWKQLVVITRADIDLCHVADLSVLRQRLEAVPDGTPGRDDAHHEIIARFQKAFPAPAGAPTGPHEDLPPERRTRSGRNGSDPVQKTLVSA